MSNTTDGVSSPRSRSSSKSQVSQTSIPSDPDRGRKVGEPDPRPGFLHTEIFQGSVTTPTKDFLFDVLWSSQSKSNFSAPSEETLSQTIPSSSTQDPCLQEGTHSHLPSRGPLFHPSSWSPTSLLPSVGAPKGPCPCRSRPKSRSFRTLV